MTAAPAADGGKLLIFDGELMSSASHCLEYDRLVARTARRHGIATTVLSHVNFTETEPLEREGVQVAPLVTRSHWLDDFREYGGRGLFFELLGRLLHGLANARDIWPALKRRRYDCVFLPSVFPADVIAWALLRPLGAFRRVGRVVFLLRWDVLDHAVSNPVPARKLVYLRLLFKFLGREIRRGRLVLLTDSRQLMLDYRRVCGVDSLPLSCPRTVPHRQRPQPGPNATITFSMIGLSRYEKGVDLLLDAIGLILASGEVPNAQFIVQLDRPLTLPDGTVYECPPEVLQSDRVDLIRHAPPPEEYEELLQRTDCMVLAYRREFYHSRTSAIAIEASCMDMPIIYTRDCWLEDYVGEFGAGLGVRSDDLAALRQAIVAMAADWEKHSGAAARQGSKARARNDAEEFLRVLWGKPLPPPVESPVPHGHERSA